MIIVSNIGTIGKEVLENNRTVNELQRINRCKMTKKSGVVRRIEDSEYPYDTRQLCVLSYLVLNPYG